MGLNSSESGARRSPQAGEEAERLPLEQLSRSDRDTAKASRRGCCCGSEEYRQGLLEKFDSFAAGAGTSDKKIRRHDEAGAERLIPMGVECLGLDDLGSQPKGSSVKIALAAFVKSRTVVTNLWIARRLQMGDPSRVSRYCAEAGSRENA